MTDKMREVWEAHDKARNKAWREDPGTFDTLDAFKAGAAWQAAKSVPVVGDVLFYASDSTPTAEGQIQYDVCAYQKDYSFFPVYRKPTNSITADELERLRKDAERYRWLRHGDNDEQCLHFATECPAGTDTVWIKRGSELDAIIDAAIAAEGEK